MTPRVGLDADAVVAEAARIADADGLDAVTLSRLAAALGVRAPSLYAHVSGLADLRVRLAARGARELTDLLQHAVAGRAGRDALIALADAYRGYARAHPGTYAALQRAPSANQDEAASRLLELALAIMRGYGLSGEPAVHAARAVRSALHGFVALEANEGFGYPLSLDESFRQLVGVLDRGLSASGAGARA